MSNKTTLECLQEGYAILVDPLHWSRGYFELDGRYCMLGACGYRINRPNESVRERILAAIRARHPEYEGTVSSFNWRSTHAEVLAVLRDAIEMEGKCQILQ